MQATVNGKSVLDGEALMMVPRRGAMRSSSEAIAH